MTVKFALDDLAKFAYAMTPGGMSRGMAQGLKSIGGGLGVLAQNRFAEEQAQAHRDFVDSQRKAGEAFQRGQYDIERADRLADQYTAAQMGAGAAGGTRKKSGTAGAGAAGGTRKKSGTAGAGTAGAGTAGAGTAGAGAAGAGTAAGAVKPEEEPPGSSVAATKTGAANKKNNALEEFQREAAAFDKMVTDKYSAYGDKIKDPLVEAEIIRDRKAGLNMALNNARQRYLRDAQLSNPLSWGYGAIPGLAEAVGEGFDANGIDQRWFSGQQPASAASPGVDLSALEKRMREDPTFMQRYPHLIPQRAPDAAMKATGLVGQGPELPGTIAPARGVMGGIAAAAAGQAGPLQRDWSASNPPSTRQQYTDAFKADGTISPEEQRVIDSLPPDDLEAQATADLVGVAPDVGAQAAMDAPLERSDVAEAERDVLGERRAQAADRDAADVLAAGAAGADIGELEGEVRDSLDQATAALGELGIPLRIVSGKRSPERNKFLQKVWDSGNKAERKRYGLKRRPADNSHHLEGRAIDFNAAGLSQDQYDITVETLKSLGWGFEGNYQAGDPRRNHMVYVGTASPDVAVADADELPLGDYDLDEELPLGDGDMPQVARKPQVRVEIGDMTLRTFASPSDRQGHVLKRDVLDPVGRAISDSSAALARWMFPEGSRMHEQHAALMSALSPEPPLIWGDMPEPRARNRAGEVPLPEQDYQAAYPEEDERPAYERAFGDQGESAQAKSMRGIFNRAMAAMPSELRAKAAGAMSGIRGNRVILKRALLSPEELVGVSKAMLTNGFTVEYDEATGEIQFYPAEASYNPNDFDE